MKEVSSIRLSRAPEATPAPRMRAARSAAFLCASLNERVCSSPLPSNQLYAGRGGGPPHQKGSLSSALPPNLFNLENESSMKF